MVAMNPDLLSVPELQNGGTRSREMRPRRLQEWLVALPPAGAAETAQALEQVLSAQNRVALAPDNRLELLELVRPAALQAGERLQSSTAAAGLPAGERSLAAMAQWRRLEAELAFGYKRLVRERLEAARHPARVPEIAAIMGRALGHLTRLLRSSCQVYQPYPAGAWGEIHTLYGLAEHHGLAESGAGELPDATGPLTAYLQAVLLGAANPYGCMTGECRRAAELLACMPLEARISAEAPSNPPTAEFVISLSADAAPMAVPRGAPVSPEPHVRILQALPQVRVVHELVKQLEHGATPAALGLGDDVPEEGLRELLQRLGRSWGLAARRHGGRTSSDATVEVCLGLGAVHHYLSGGEAPVAARRPPVREGEVFIDLDTLAAVPGEPGPDGAGSGYEIQAWSCRNQGAEGFGLTCHLNGTRELVRVGELVGVRNPGARPMQVATVRWARHREPRLELGLHVLGPNARPVSVRARSGPDAPWHDAVLLPAASALRRPETLLVPRMTFEIGDTLLMSEGGAEPVTIRAIQLYDQTGAFDQCVFVRLDGAEG